MIVETIQYNEEEVNALLCVLSHPGFWTVWTHGWRYLNSTMQLIPSLPLLQLVFVKFMGQVSFCQFICRSFFLCLLSFTSTITKTGEGLSIWGKKLDWEQDT